jgi:hypothetical protein
VTGLSDSWRFAVTLDDEGNPRTLQLGGEELELQNRPIILERKFEVLETDAMVAHDLAVLRRDEGIFVLRLDDIDSGRVFGQANLYYAFDPTLPGPPGPDPDPPVVYECPNGDLVTQPASSPNRTCPAPGCGEQLSPA